MKAFYLFLLWAPLVFGSQDCEQDKKVLHSEFIILGFDKDRMTVGKDQIEPIKLKILEFIKSNPQIKISDITVTASSSKAPFYKTSGGKKTLDPEVNFRLATERAIFVRIMLKEIKASSSQLAEVTITATAELAGPEFKPIDLNDRFVTKMTSGYFKMLADLYNENKKLYAAQALKKSFEELTDEKQFSNLFQAKFKPFQGFRIKISGCLKQ
jgi:hypothetical protein